MVLLRFRNLLLCRVGSGILVRSNRHALLIVCTVQCFLGLPTRFFDAMFGRARPLNVAFLVGEVSGSLKVCIRSLCCDALIWVDIVLFFLLAS